jgi:hypothetical protein
VRFSNNNDAALAAFFPEIVLTPVEFCLTVSSASQQEHKNMQESYGWIGLEMTSQERVLVQN